MMPVINLLINVPSLTLKTVSGNVILSANGTANYSFTLPQGSGVSGQFLTSFGNGNLTWYTPNFSTANTANVFAAAGNPNNIPVFNNAAWYYYYL